MVGKRFIDVQMNESNPKWNKSITRINNIYKRTGDMRSQFERDYNRILHCTAYRRLKNKTQVFSAPHNDHICTRIEHVNHVTSVSYTIAKYLGLNTELTNAIAIGHDLGHAPFGHSGEDFLKKITKRELGETFWHEKNSLRVVDKVETLEDREGVMQNLNLTYAVRDGIVSHCGEVNENAVFPRNEYIDLNIIEKPNEYQPYTWEGCIVKIADKISYLGRDIQDAVRLNILTKRQLSEFKKILNVKLIDINNAILMHDFISNLCQNSSPEAGICFSKKHLQLINQVKEFNYKYIYFHPRLVSYDHYAELIINSIFDILKECYSKDIFKSIKKHEKYHPLLTSSFIFWLQKYSNKRGNKADIFGNVILYNIENEKDYYMAIIDYIASMTDLFAIDIFNELTSF